jgi:YVTN family beta-propeller protein
MVGFTLPFTSSASVPIDAGMVVDPITGDVFVSGGATSSFIEVVSPQGQALGQIAGQSGATGLALSADGGTLYVADQGSDSIAIIDTATLTQTGSYPTTGLAPDNLALTGGNLWFTTGSDYLVHEVDLATGVVSTTSASTSYYGSLLAASPSAPDTLVTGTPGLSPATVYVYNVASGMPVEVSGGWLGNLDGSGCSNLGGMAITADGKSLILACGAPYVGLEVSLSAMALEQTYDTGAYPAAAAVSSDGKVLIGADSEDPNLDEFDVGGSSPVGGLNFMPDAEIQAVAWGNGDSQVYAILDTAGSTQPLTFVAFEQYPSLTLTAPAATHPGSGYTVSGALSLLGDAEAGAKVTVTRTIGSTTTTVGTFTTNSAGGFSFTDGGGAIGTTVTYSAVASGWSEAISATASTTSIPVAYPITSKPTPVRGPVAAVRVR